MRVSAAVPVFVVRARNILSANAALVIWLMPVAIFILAASPIWLYVFFHFSIMCGYVLALGLAVLLLRAFKVSWRSLLLGIGSTLIVWVVLCHTSPFMNQFTYAMRAKIAVEPTFTSCKDHAFAIGHEGAVNVCEVHAFDSWLVNGDEVILYDSTHQIMLPPDRRSTEWKAKVRSLKHVPFGVLWFTATKVVGPYYYVRFENMPDINNTSF